MTRSSRTLGNLPAEASSFVGRRHALAELRRKLATARLVSIVGPGGVGKTRLALRIASDLTRGFRAGAWLVELAEVRDPALVPNAVLAALDLRDQAGGDPLALVLSYLRDKELLLVVDNCEHVVAVAADVVCEVINAAPAVRVIVTSREPLSVLAEHVVALAPLELPRAGSTETLAQLKQNEAVALFTDRATAASGTFELTRSNQAAVVDLCRRLDGLPLAIELAAVRTRALTPAMILDRLNDRFRLLRTGSRAALPRHRTLETAFEWSHDLLCRDEQRLLRRLSVFAGRFSFEDVEGICTFDGLSGPTRLDLLSSLVEKSLVMMEDVNGLAWYRLHETMREYARLKLEIGEEDRLEERAADYYLSKCRRSASGARFRLLEWLELLDLDIDNIRAVLRRCVDHEDAARGIALATSLTWYWITRATTEGARWLDELLQFAGGAPQARAWAWGIRGFLAVLQADPATARPAFERAVAGAQEFSDRSLLSHSLSLWSIGEHFAGDVASAARLLNEAQRATNGLDDLPAQLTLLQARSLDGFFRDDLDAVRSASTEGARLSRQADDLYTLGVWLLNLGLAALIAGDLDRAKPLVEEGLLIARQIDDRLLQGQLIGAAGCRVASSAPRLAARLLGASEKLRAEVGASPFAPLTPLATRTAEWLKSALGPTRFETELNAGERLARSAALALALGETQRAFVKRPYNSGFGPLAPREMEVARLVADGLSNKQIGARLFISERTVENHVRNIMNKLGFHSRTQVAGWMVSPDARQREGRDQVQKPLRPPIPPSGPTGSAS